MLTETYRKDQVAPEGDTISASSEVESYESKKKQRQELLEKAGFRNRANQESNHSNRITKLETAPVFYEELNGKQLRTWRKFLPTSHSREHYMFDAVPDDALEEIIFAQEVDCFDRIEIWTPEGNSFLGLIARVLEVAQDKLDQLMAELDPMAVGVIKDTEGKEHFFPIVRWGEALLPFKEIKRHVRSVHWKAKVLFGVLPTLMVLFGLTAYYNGIVAFGYSSMVLATVLAIFGFILLGRVLIFIADMLSL